MLSSDEEDYDVFFDSADRLSSEGSTLADEELGCSNLDYQIWVSEPHSVKERRECFLRRMGLDEFGSSMISSEEIKTGMEVGCSSKLMGLDRVRECSGGASSSCGEEGDDKANVMCNELDGNLHEKANMVFTQEECRQSSAEIHVECQSFHQGRKKMRSWWKRFVNKGNVRCSKVVSDESNSGTETPKRANIQVRQNKKRCVEFTAPYIGQEIYAHKGFIWTMKFSPDGQYLASGGEDGIVRVWRVTVADASSDYLAADGNFCSRLKEGKSSFRRKHSIHASVIFPDKVFQIDESPYQEFRGHSSDVLDLAWSNSNCLLSSSKDKTVRQWQVGCDQCLNVFHHNNYVTCIQFNPIDDNYFISGSIDGKVRIWGLYEKRVVDWVDVRDVITAICYRPDGEGFVVGSITGTCRFYEASGECLLLDAQMHIPGRKKTAGNKITGIKFSQDRTQRVMISSEDSKLRIFDGVDLVHKYKGLPKSGSQMSASFTSSGRHIISVGEDSRVYVWNYDEMSVSSSKQTKSVRSCEHFFHEGVSVAIPWFGMGAEQGSLASETSQYSSQAYDYLERSSWIRDSDRFSLGNWFSMDGSCRGSVTWPEEKLPVWDISVVEDQNHLQHLQETPKHHNDKAQNNTALSETWGLVIVTGGWDGTIRIFHNYGLPADLVGIKISGRVGSCEVLVDVDGVYYMFFLAY